MEQIGNKIINCATCAFWLGQRFPNRLGFIEVPCKTDGGRCSLKGLNEHRQYQGIYSCANYKKWSLIEAL